MPFQTVQQLDTLECRLRDNYKEIKDPSIFSAVEDFLFEHPYPNSSPYHHHMTPVFIKKLTKVARHALSATHKESTGITKDLRLLEACITYCKEGIYRMARHIFSRQCVKYTQKDQSGIRGHLYAYLSEFQLYIADNFRQQSAELLKAAFKNRTRALRICAEDPAYVAYSYSFRANIAKRLYDLTQDHLWLQRSCEDNVAGASGVKQFDPEHAGFTLMRAAHQYHELSLFNNTLSDREQTMSEAISYAIQGAELLREKKPQKCARMYYKAAAFAHEQFKLTRAKEHYDQALTCYREADQYFTQHVTDSVDEAEHMRIHRAIKHNIDELTDVQTWSKSGRHCVIKEDNKDKKKYHRPSERIKAIRELEEDF